MPPLSDPPSHTRSPSQGLFSSHRNLPDVPHSCSALSRAAVSYRPSQERPIRPHVALELTPLSPHVKHTLVSQRTDFQEVRCLALMSLAASFPELFSSRAQDQPPFCEYRDEGEDTGLREVCNVRRLSQIRLGVRASRKRLGAQPPVLLISVDLLGY